MKSILLSIRPEWVAKILNGEKTIEIVKSSLERKEKLEKVWEICKKNIVNLDMICKSESWGYYDGYCAKHYFPRITKEEFNLLKEMLNEKMC